LELQAGHRDGRGHSIEVLGVSTILRFAFRAGLHFALWRDFT
jgi:hypothetical protein